MSNPPDGLDPSPHPALVEIALAIADEGGASLSQILSDREASNSPDVLEFIDRLGVVDRIIRGHQELRSSSALATDSGTLPADLAEVRWGPLVVREKIGSGSFGLVYRAWDPRLDRTVALKVLDDERGEPDAVVEEARTLARVHHPNVVSVFGAERIDGRTGIWMEFIEGQSLAAEVAERGPLSPIAAARIGMDVCRALAAVHNAGLLHRDVKAQNVIRGMSGRTVLTDFGTSVDLGDAIGSGSQRIAGTPLYLAPELFSGAAASIASDQYSVGVLLYFLVSGTFPIRGQTTADVRRAHAEGRRTPLAAATPTVPADFARIVERLIDPDSARRYESMEAVARSLALWIEKSTRSWTRRYAGAAAVLVLLAIGGGAWNLLSHLENKPLGLTARLIENPPCMGPATVDGAWIACAIDAKAASGELEHSLIRFNVISGEKREVWRGPGKALWHVTISPNGGEVAAAVTTPDSGGQPREIRIFNIHARRWRTIATMPADTTSLVISGWNRTDDLIDVYLLRSNLPAALALVSPSTEKFSIAFEFPSPPSTWRRSADGRWLTYGSDRDVRVCDLSSRVCEVVAAHPATDFLPFFAPDGALMFSSDRGGTIALWRVELDGMRERGMPTLVRDLGRDRLIPLGFGDDGLLYILESGAPDVLLADLDAPGTPLVRSLVAAIKVSRAPAWSPDGKQLATISTSGNYSGFPSLQLNFRKVATGEERTFELPEARFNPARVAWSTDSRMLAMRVLVPGPPRPQIGLQLVDSERGPLPTVLRRESPTEKFLDDQLGDFAWLDDRTIVFAKSGGVGMFEVPTGKESPLWMAPSGSSVVHLALSRDRSWLALTLKNEGGQPMVSVVPARASTAVLPVLHPGATGWVQTWTADGRAILVTRSAPATAGTNVVEVWSVPVDGSEPTRMPIAAPGLSSIKAHPDGRRFAVAVQGPKHELFVGLGR